MSEQEPKIAISEVILMLEQIVPSSLVQRSWSLGPQRMCQELNRTLYKLRNIRENALHNRGTEQ